MRVHVKRPLWLRRLVADLLLQRPGFSSRSVHVGFVVDRVALGQVSVWVLGFSPVSFIPPWLPILISSGRWTAVPFVVALQRQGLAPPTRASWTTCDTERRGWVVNTPALYSGGPGFKSLPGDRLSWLRFFVFFFSVLPGECRYSTLN
jgi:hypothetical protein